MRVAQVTYSYKPVRGGADVYALALHELLQRAGYESLVWQGGADGADGDEVRPIPETPLSALGRGRFWALPLGLRRARAEIASCDVVIAHYANYHRALEWHPATVLLSHGVWWDDRPGALRSRIKKALNRRAFRRAKSVVANDTFFLREMGLDVQPGCEPHSEVLPGRYYVPNDVDLQRFSPGPAGTTDGPRLILVPRNIYRNRGVHLAIQAMALLRAEPDLVMRIVGGVGQADYAEECRRLIDDLGLGGRVAMAGAVCWERMPEEYRAADLCLVPTVCGEGTSLSALESMACGTPCVATAVAGLRDLPALLCEPTPEAIAAACREALDRRDELARQQREAVQQHHGKDRWEAAWLGILEETAAGAR